MVIEEEYAAFSNLEMLKGIDLGRIGEPIDIVTVALFCASDASNYITGQIISVSGKPSY